MKGDARARATLACLDQFILRQVQYVEDRAHAAEVLTQEHVAQRLEADLIELNLCGALAYSQALRILLRADQPVRIAALDRKHAPRIFRLDAGEQVSARVTAAV